MRNAGYVAFFIDTGKDGILVSSLPTIISTNINTICLILISCLLIILIVFTHFDVYLFVLIERMSSTNLSITNYFDLYG